MVEIWKDPNCGCCQDWVKHLNANGFATRVHDNGNDAARARLGIPAKLGSCHTGLVGGYALEGHVPAREVHRLLREKPKAAGLAVPGMPVAHPAWTAPPTGTGAIRTTCCWCSPMAAAACTRATAEAKARGSVPLS
jgi:hypothetical protein